MTIGQLRSARPATLASPRLPRIDARVAHLIQFAILAAVVLWVVYVVYVIWWGFSLDYQTYMGVAHRVLRGGPAYTPDQVVGPHYVTGGSEGDNMYPPMTLPLFLLFGALPQPLSLVIWYAIPLTVIGWFFRSTRPTGWRLVAVALLSAYPPSIGVIFLGNPAMWVVAALCLAWRWPWVSAFVLLKPSVLPFAFVGVRDRRWWIALAGFGLLALILLPLTVDYINVVLNARGPFSGVGYSLPNVPIMLIPFVAWRQGTQRVMDPPAPTHESNTQAEPFQ